MKKRSEYESKLRDDVDVVASKRVRANTEELPRMSYYTEVQSKPRLRIGSPNDVASLYVLDDICELFSSENGETIKWLKPNVISEHFSKCKNDDDVDRSNTPTLIDEDVTVVKIEPTDEMITPSRGVKIASMIPKAIMDKAISYANEVAKTEALEYQRKNVPTFTLTVTDSKYKDVLREWIGKKHPKCLKNVFLSKEVPVVNRYFTSVALTDLKSSFFEMMFREKRPIAKDVSFGYVEPNVNMLYHETVYKSDKCRLFYDFDYKLKSTGNDSTLREYVELKIDSINAHVMKRMADIATSTKEDDVGGKRFENNDDFIFSIVWDSSNEQKISKHVFFSNQSDIMLFRKKQNAGDFFKFCIFEWMLDELQSIENEDDVKLFKSVVEAFDLPLYFKNGEFRTIFSTKLHASRHVVPDRLAFKKGSENPRVVPFASLTLVRQPSLKTTAIKKSRDLLFFSSESDDDNDETTQIPDRIDLRTMVTTSKTVLNPDRFAITTIDAHNCADWFKYEAHYVHDVDDATFVDWDWLTERSLVGVFDDASTSDSSYVKYIRYKERDFIKFTERSKLQRDKNDPSILFGRRYSKNAVSLLDHWLANVLTGNDNKHTGETPYDIFARLYDSFSASSPKAVSNCADASYVVPSKDHFESGSANVSFRNASDIFSDEYFKTWVVDKIVSSDKTEHEYIPVFKEMIESGSFIESYDRLMRELRGLIPSALSNVWSSRSVFAGDLCLRIKQKKPDLVFYDASVESGSSSLKSEEPSPNKTSPDDSVEAMIVDEYDGISSEMFKSRVKDSETRKTISRATMRFELENCKHCPIKYDRCLDPKHKGNHIYYTVDFLRKRLYLGCYDEGCFNYSVETRSNYGCDIPSHLHADINIFLQLHVMLRSLI